MSAGSAKKIRAAILLLAGWSLHAQASPGPQIRQKYAGDEACRACHATEFETYYQTAHHLTSRAPSRESILGSFNEEAHEIALRKFLYFAGNEKGTMVDGRETTRRGFMRTTGAAMFGVAVGARASFARGAKPEEPASANTFNVRNFGATGDGSILDTPSINKAIDAAAAAGGGTVHLPAGNYLCYSIRVKSNVQLYLASGATIVAADSPSQPSQQAYDLAEPNAPWESYQDYGHNHWHNSLIWGEGLDNVSICGPGLIWGKGLSRGAGQGPVAEIPGAGNKAIALKNCRDVLLRDFSILHGGHFGILATGVDNLTIDNLKIDTNRDGMDVDCCRNVRISNCSVNSPRDDAICLKSSYALGYPRATEMVTISDCLVSGSFEEGTLLDATYKRFPANADIDRNGRIKFGTESNGGYKNITVSNCVFDGCYGLTILSVDGAIIEDVSISNITMRDTVASPIFIRLGARMRGPAGVPVGAIRRVNISNVVSSSASSKICSMISGVPGHKIEDVKISNVLVRHGGGGTKKDASIQLEEKEQGYPEPTMFGTTPAHGLLIRHAQGIEVSDFKVLVEVPEKRPCVVVDDAEHVDFFNVKSPKQPDAPLFVLNDVKDFNAAKCGGIPDTQIAETKRKEI
jgi:polygalacturonase